MTSHKKETTGLIIALFLMSVAGALLHSRTHSIHPGPQGVVLPANFIPFAVGIAGIVVTPVLLWFRRTLIVGYLFNGMGAVIGMVLMTYFSLVKVEQPFTLTKLITGTVMSDVILLFAKLFIGQRILLTYLPAGMGRMFTGWWWTRHIVYISAMFVLGHFIWR